MPRKHREIDPIEEINIMPLMNIIMLLIPFLIMSTEFVKIGVINVSTPLLCGTPCTTHSDPTLRPPPPLNLTLNITHQGITLLTRGARIPQGCDLKPQGVATHADTPTFPQYRSQHAPALHACLAKIKALFPHERRLVIMGEEAIPYHKIVEIMDVSRESNHKPLFPEVMLSAGIL